MKKIFLGNAFSLQMLDLTIGHTIKTWPISVNAAKELVTECETISAIGHVDTARVVSDMLGIDIEANRINLQLEASDMILVAQITGGRLPEGATTLPKGFEMKFVCVEVER